MSTEPLQIPSIIHKLRHRDEQDQIWQGIGERTALHFAKRPECAFFRAFIGLRASVAEASVIAHIDTRTGYNYRREIAMYAGLLAVEAGVMSAWAEPEGMPALSQTPQQRRTRDRARKKAKDE